MTLDHRNLVNGGEGGETNNILNAVLDEKIIKDIRIHILS